LTFVSPPDFEQPKDFGADNVYNLTLQVSDGTLTATQEVSVTVMGVNDNAPLISSSGTISIAENSSAVTLLTAADADFPAQALSYAAIGGADSALFAVNPTTGDLTFVSPPDFEQPKDFGADNVYNLTVQVSDGTFNTTQDMTVTVTAVNDNTPAFTSPAGLSVAENSMTIATLTTADADLPTQALTYSVIGGADAAYFNFNSTTGALSFIAVHDYELPNDSNKDNIYNLVIQVSDGTLTAAQEISVTVLPVNDNTPVITTPDKISVSENVLTVAIITTTDADRPAQILTYAITGGADAAKFSIVNATGELKFITAPDFETPADANRDNAYEVTVQVSDGVSDVTKNISVQVTDKAD
jgi:serralysin